MGTITEWLEQQVSESRPADGLVGAEIKRRIRALAEAVQALREGDGTAFGMHLDHATRSACGDAAVKRLEAALEEWRAYLATRAGDKGRRVVEELVAAYGIHLPQPSISN